MPDSGLQMLSEVVLEGNAEEAQENEDGFEEVYILGDFGDEGQQLVDNRHVNAMLLCRMFRNMVPGHNAGFPHTVCTSLVYVTSIRGAFASMGCLALGIFDPCAEYHGGYDTGNPARQPENEGQNDGTATLVIDRGGWQENADQRAHQAHVVFPFRY